LSVDAVQLKVSPVCVTDFADNAVGAEGAVVSGHGAVVTFVVDLAETFPAAS
jgi:hypothetical protein